MIIIIAMWLHEIVMNPKSQGARTLRVRNREDIVEGISTWLRISRIFYISSKKTVLFCDGHVARVSWSPVGYFIDSLNVLEDMKKPGNKLKKNR